MSMIEMIYHLLFFCSSTVISSSHALHCQCDAHVSMGFQVTPRRRWVRLSGRMYLGRNGKHLGHIA
jgi:hypothetical protein